MNDPRLEQLFEDIEVDAVSREIVGHYYRAALREGRSEDEALDMAAIELRRMRAEWEAAKQEDGDA